MMAETAIVFFWIAGAYALGSVPSGVVLTRLFSGEDIRKQGSGNIGATNVSRVAGVVPGLLTLVLDILKGALPVLVAALWAPVNPLWVMAAAGLAAFLGHLYPVCFRFRGGGKGVATACGVFLVAAPLACLIAALVFAGVVLVFRRVSAGSLAAALALPAAVWLVTGSAALFACAGCIGLLVIWRHKDNIRRLIRGEEP